MQADGGQAMTARMRAAQVDTLYRNVTVSVLVSAFAAITLAVSMAVLGSAPAERSAGWAVFVCACATVHIGMRWQRQRLGFPDDAWQVWGRRFAAVALAEGIAWGWAAIGLTTSDRYDFELIAMLVSYAMAGGVVSVFGSHRLSFWCFFLPCTVPFAFTSVVHGGIVHGSGEQLAAGVLATYYVVGMGLIGMRTHAEFNYGLRLRFDMDELAHAFRRQKELAEEANLAKSRFLASASHDLRQPVHALSLSVGALKALSMPAAALELVHHIEQSVEALDGLFTALLDVSRLDAGVITPEPRAFAIQPVIDRVYHDHALRGGGEGGGAARGPVQPGRPHRPGAVRACGAKPRLQRGTLHRPGPRARGLPAGHRDPGAGVGHRPGHSRCIAGSGVRGVLPGQQPSSGTARRGWAWGWRSYGGLRRCWRFRSRCGRRRDAARCSASGCGLPRWRGLG